MMRGCLLTLACLVVLCCAANLRVDTNEVINLYDGRKLQDCLEAREAGYNQSGLYKLWVNGTQRPSEVFCKMDKLTGGEVVILWRVSGNEEFRRGWTDYRTGFGNPASGDYWVGLDLIYYLTKKWSRLTIQMGDWNNNHAAVTYSRFALTDTTSYRLSIGGYGGGPIPDNFTYLNGMPFATSDHPDYHRCVDGHKAGWWYNYCTYNLLTGHYYYGGKYVPSGPACDGIYWGGWPYGQGCDYSLKYVVMYLTQ